MILRDGARVRAQIAAIKGSIVIIVFNTEDLEAIAVIGKYVDCGITFAVKSKGKWIANAPGWFICRKSDLSPITEEVIPITGGKIIISTDTVPLMPSLKVSSPCHDKEGSGLPPQLHPASGSSGNALR